LQKKEVLSLELKRVGDGKLIIISMTVSGMTNNNRPVAPVMLKRQRLASKTLSNKSQLTKKTDGQQISLKK